MVNPPVENQKVVIHWIQQRKSLIAFYDTVSNLVTKTLFIMNTRDAHTNFCTLRTPYPSYPVLKFLPLEYRTLRTSCSPYLMLEIRTCLPYFELRIAAVLPNSNWYPWSTVLFALSMRDTCSWKWQLESPTSNWKERSLNVRAEVGKFGLQFQSFDWTWKESMKLESYYCSWKNQ